MSRTNPKTGLNERQERFCHAFVATGNAAKAAAEAGYSPRHARNHGYRLIRKSLVRNRIADLRASIARDSIGDRGMLMAKIEEIFRRALEHRDFAAALRVVQTQARMLGYEAPWKPSAAERNGMYCKPWTRADDESEARKWINFWYAGADDFWRELPPIRPIYMTTDDDKSAEKSSDNRGASNGCVEKSGTNAVQPGPDAVQAGPNAVQRGPNGNRPAPLAASVAPPSRSALGGLDQRGDAGERLAFEPFQERAAGSRDVGEPLQHPG